MDLKAMKEKLAALANKGGKTNDSILKLKEGTQVLRIVPLKDSPDSAFQEFLFHYIGNKTYLSPRTYGEVDPIADFSDALVAGGGLTKEEYKEAKKLSPQIRTYCPVIVRGQEDQGVKFWGFGKTTFETILKIMAEEDVDESGTPNGELIFGDISHVAKGYDLRVIFTPQEKSDTKFAKTEVTPLRKSSVLSADAALRDKWLNEQPVLVNIFKKHTKEELEDVLAKYLNPESAKPQPSASAAPKTAPSSGAGEDEWANDAKPAEKVAPKVTLSKDVQEEFSTLFNS